MLRAMLTPACLRLLGDRMSDALEMTKEEWTEWRAMLDEPFWSISVLFALASRLARA